MKTLFHVEFRNAGNEAFFLDTTDEAKIGPWLAEMFSVFPYTVVSPNQVRITRSRFK